ncbi:hypothetical protein K440DRAFT_608728 [Wilcoxina mikolae CBS 423.85]|nr:hypothetical protein K440DRAFT_608728 [Wilcoxina mikolae CBS 423.85]
MHWTVEDWRRVIWTNESTFNIGGARGNIWVTRFPGEEYDKDCLVPKFRKLSRMIVWGAIDGITGKLRLVVWDKNLWGKTITGLAYITHILPLLTTVAAEEAEKLYPGPYPLWIMEDNVRVLTVGICNTFRQENWPQRNLQYMEWPVSSYDLNPIEEVWRRMKDYLARMPERPTTVEDMGIAVWNA